MASMITYAIYLVVILACIRYAGCFTLFNDGAITRARFATLFLLKALAVPVFYLVYKRTYGGIEHFDAGKFFQDASVINEYGRSHPGFFVRLLLGLQDDNETSADFRNCLVNTTNWDNGNLKNYLYNDNRVITRIHSVLHFITFGSYFAHALFSCFFSFIGITYLYHSFKEFFKGKEFHLLLVMCFLPALWFYTGALLKEGPTLMIMGCLTYTLKNLLNNGPSIKMLLAGAVLLAFSLLLKPYILLFSLCCFGTFFVSQKLKRNRILFFISVITVVIAGANLMSVLWKDRSLAAAAIEHQKRFADAAKGGIFLLNEKKFVRLPFDSTLLKKTVEKKWTIKKNVPLIYWHLSNTNDTLYDSSNQDTISQFTILYTVPESRSNINLFKYSGSALQITAAALYYTLFHPLFINATTPLQLMASAENLMVIISLLVIISGLVSGRKDHLLPLAFILLSLVVCLLIGVTTPNSGAIFRYRAPVIIFLLMAALYYAGSKEKSLRDPD